MSEENGCLKFTNKTALFVGDSIVEGVTTEYKRTPDTWVKLLSEKLGMRYINIGVGDSCYVKGYNKEIISIDENLKNYIKSVHNLPDLIFIGGGCNDWMFGVPIKEYEAELKKLFLYIRDYFKEIVVVIVTPINPSWKYRIKHPGISKYRELLRKIAEEFGFVVIHGEKFEWNEKSVNSREILWDGIHPTELGYRLYAENVYKQLMEIG